MGKIMKLLGIVVGAVLILFIAAMLGLTIFFDPNDYKDEIAAAVEQSTGRQLTLEGDLELDVFPGVRIALGEAELSNAAGFGDEPFARIAGAGLSVGLLPLLSRRIEIGEARLEGLVLNLERDAGGAVNWELGGGGDAPAAAEGGPGDGGGLDLDVGAIVIADAEVSFSDAAAGSAWQLGGFNLNASGFGPGAVFPLDLEFTVAGDDINLAVAASMDATLGLADNVYRLDELDVEIAGSGPAWPGGAGDATLSFSSFTADLSISDM